MATEEDIKYPSEPEIQTIGEIMGTMQVEVGLCIDTVQ